MHAQTPAFENGRVLLPKQAHWLPDYIHEMVTFPKGKYDGQVDSTSQALKWITVEGIEPGIISYYIWQIAQQRGVTMEQVRQMQRDGTL